MKFTNGYWVVRDGFSANFAAQAYDVREQNGTLEVYAPVKVTKTRGDSLNATLLTVRYSSPMPNVIKVKVSHYEGSYDAGPYFELNSDSSFKPAISISEKEASITSGNLTANVSIADFWKVTYTNDKGRQLTKSESKSAAYMVKHSHPQEHMFYSDELPFMKDELSLGVGEYVYGLGERFGSFVKNGQTVDIWNADGGTASEQAYKNIPFYMTNRGYGVFVNNPGAVSFEVASEKVSRVQFSVPGESLEYYVIYGPEPKQVLERYTALTGRPALPPKWTFGLWLSTSFTTSYDEKTVMHFIDGMFERKIPLSVFHFDCFWMKGFHWSDFIWDEETFPDPAGLIKRLHDRGLKVCVWINSYIAQRSYLFKEGMEKGYFIKKRDGSVWQTDLWQAGMAVVDFTNPDACKWYASKLRALLDMGVDCFKTDFGERIPTNCVYYDGSDPEKMHNYYTYLYNKTVYELLERKRGKGEAVLFARSATVGGQKFPVHWGGDCWSDYPSMEESLRGGLSLLMSGFGFWAHDIGGFENTSTADVYKRWVAFGLLSSHSRLHGSSSYRVPWVYDDEAVDVVRSFTKLKASLMPYLYKTSVDTSKSGVPTMRSMVLEFTADRNCHYLDKQYMLGDNLLVAPIFNDQSMGIFYLPKGTWTDFFTGEVMEGGTWVERKYDYLHLPLMARENSIIAMGACDNRPDYDYADGAELRIYSMQDGGKAETVIYDQKQNVDLTASAERAGNQITLKTEGSKKFSVRLINVKAASADGAELAYDGNDTVLTGCAKAVTVTL